MPKILCTIPNASTNINGVAFISHKLGMISEEVDEAVAKKFASIKGYEIFDPSAPRPVASAPAPAGAVVAGKCPTCGHDATTPATAPAPDSAALAILEQAKRNEQLAGSKATPPPAGAPTAPASTATPPATPAGTGAAPGASPPPAEDPPAGEKSGAKDPSF